MDIYEELGVKKVINAAGTYTAIGASRMSKETQKLMIEASNWNVQIEELQKKVNNKIAEMTHNEAAYVCNSCSSAIYLSVAACISRHYDKDFNHISREEIQQCEVIALWGQRLFYHSVIEQLGAKIKYIGYSNMESPLSTTELKAAINNNTICSFFISRTPDGYYGESCMNLIDFLHTSKECNVPVLVDAAAQLPPKSNLWRFTEMGAEMVCFSGGKDLAGPQASGLLVGKMEYIKAISEIGFPHSSYGRLMKIGREEIVALYSAIREYLDRDEKVREQFCEQEINNLINKVNCTRHFNAERTWPNEAKQPLPRAFVSIKDNSINASQLRSQLMKDEPGVFCYSENKNGVYINPMCLDVGEMDVIAERFISIDKSL